MLDMTGSQEEAAKRHANELSEVADVVRCARSEVDDLTRLVRMLDQRVSSLSEELRSESMKENLQRELTMSTSQHDERLQAMRLEMNSMVTQSSLEVCLEQIKTVLSKQVVESESRLGENLGALQRRHMAELRAEPRSDAITRLDLSTRLEEVQREIFKEMTRQVEASEVRLGEELGGLQQRLISELRAETTAAFRSEAAAVASLDEQIWLTDQRLGQRIDELLHLRIRDVEREVVAERRHAQHTSPIVVKRAPSSVKGVDRSPTRTVHIRPGGERVVESIHHEVQHEHGGTTETVEYSDGEARRSPRALVTEYHVEVSAENVDRDSQIAHGETHAERRVNMGGRSHDLYGKDGSRHGRTTGETLWEMSQNEGSGVEDSGRRGHTVIHTRTHERPFTGTFLASLDTEARDRERESDGTESHRSFRGGLMSMASEAADSVVGGVRRSLDARRHEARDHQGRFTTGGIAMAGLAADALGAR